MHLPTRPILAGLAITAILLGAARAEARDAGADVYVVKHGKTVRKIAATSVHAAVYVDAAAGLIYRVRGSALEATDLAGELRWRRDLGIERTSFVAGCVFRDPKVVVLWTSRRIHGIAKATGKVLYRIEDPDRDPTQLFERGAHLYMVDRYQNPRVRRYDPATGKILWTARPLPEKREGGSRHIGVGWLRSYRLHFRYFDPETGSPLPVTVPSASTRTLLATPDIIYALDRARARLAAHDARSGTKRWEVAVPKSVDRLLPAAAHGRLLLGSKQRVFVLDLDKRAIRFDFPFHHGRGGAEVQQYPDVILAADGSPLIAYDASRGTVLWRTPSDGTRTAAPGPPGQILESVWTGGGGAKPGNGVVRARRVRDGTVLWTWRMPPFEHAAQRFAGLRVESTQALGLLFHVTWHVYD